MLDFMEYVQNAFYEASHWNRNNSYGTLTATSQGLLAQALHASFSSSLTLLCSSPGLPYPARPPLAHIFTPEPPLRNFLLACIHRITLRFALLPLHLPPPPIHPICNTLPPPARLRSHLLPATTPPTPARPTLVVGDMACGQTGRQPGCATLRPPLPA